MKRIIMLCLLAFVVYFATLFAKGSVERALQTTILDEASGLAHSYVNTGILYSHNDSGGDNDIYGIDADGRLIATIKIDGVKNRDWEDIATGLDPKTGKAHIYIGEIGDNGARYPSVTIYKVPEPTFTKGDTLYTAKNYKAFNIQYEDGPRDAEALFVEPRSGDIYIISKREEKVGLYHVPYPQSTDSMNIAKKVAVMNLSWVTAADISPNGKHVLVKTYTGIRKYKIDKKKGVAGSLTAKGKSMPYKLEPQGEAICFDAKGKGYYTLSEKGEDAPQVLYYYK